MTLLWKGARVMNVPGWQRMPRFSKVLKSVRVAKNYQASERRSVFWEQGSDAGFSTVGMVLALLISLSLIV